MATSPQTVTLEASTVATVTIDGSWPYLEIAVVDDPAAVYLTVDGSTPTVGGNFRAIGAAAGAILVPTVSAVDSPVVKLISAGTPVVNIRGARTLNQSTYYHNGVVAVSVVNPATDARPEGALRVLWIGGDSQPSNMESGDLWVEDV